MKNLIAFSLFLSFYISAFAQTNIRVGNITASGPIPWVDVTGKGARCDGSTDDTSAFASAISAAVAVGGNVFIPDGKTCVIATNSSPALNLDEQVTTGITCGLPSGKGRPGGGLTLTCVLKFTGTPAIAVGARASFGIAISGVSIQASNASFSGTLLDASHFPGDTRCGGSACDTENINISNATFSAPSTSCAIGVNFDKVIDSNITNSHFFGCTTQLQGASASGSYSNVIKIRDSDFTGATGVSTFIMNPGESWVVEGNTFETNSVSVSTLGNTGSFADTIGLSFIGNWDGDDTGSGAYTKYVLPTGTTGSFVGNRISANRASTTGFSIGNNSTLTFSGNSIDGATFSTLFSIGTGVVLNVGPQKYGTVTTFLSGTPAAGSVVTDNTGIPKIYGAAVIPTSLQVGGSPAFTGALGTGTSLLTNNSEFDYNTGCSGTATSSATMFLQIPGIVATCTDTAGNVPFVLAIGNSPFPVYDGLDCVAGTGGKVAGSGVVTLQLNGVDTALTCTFGTGTTCADFSHSVTSGGTGEKIRLKYTTQATETLANVACAFRRR